MKRPAYPRIACCIPGCRRGTTTCPPGHTIICGKCWRKAPKALRDQQARWRRKARLLDRNGNPRAQIAWARVNGTFWAIYRLLTEPPAAEDLSPLMAEELREAGLL